MLTGICVVIASAAVTIAEAPLVIMAVALRCTIGLLDDLVCDRVRPIL